MDSSLLFHCCVALGKLLTSLGPAPHPHSGGVSRWYPWSFPAQPISILGSLSPAVLLLSRHEVMNQKHLLGPFLGLPARQDTKGKLGEWKAYPSFAALQLCGLGQVSLHL